MSDLGSTRVLGDLIVTGAIINDGMSDSNHSHSDATTSVSGFMSAADKTKLNGIAANANNYSHPTGDGNLHVPATSTSNANKFLRAGSTAGSLSWSLVNWGDIGSKPSTFSPSSHTHGIADLTGVAATGHKHVFADITGVAAASHTHAFADLTGVAASSHTHAYITGTYISGGGELPNYFGSNKLKLQMLQGPTNWGWSDTLWMSSYGGGDVKGSNQIVISKTYDKIGFRRQNYDATAWGTIKEIYHTGFKPTAADVGAVPLSGGTLTGTIRFPAAYVGSGDAYIYVENSNKDLCFRGGSSTDGYTYMAIKQNGVFINNDKVITTSTMGSSHNHNTLVLDSFNSIDLRDHSNHTWFRNQVGTWTFQSGDTGDDWTKCFQIKVPPITTQGDNAEWVVIGQQQSNTTLGKYRGISIVKTDNGHKGGDLSIGTLYGYGNKVAIRTDDAWLRINDQGSFTSGIYCGASKLRTDGSFEHIKNGVTWSLNNGNSSYTHYNTSAPSGHWFNTVVRVSGEIYAGSGYNNQVWHAGNMRPMRHLGRTAVANLNNANYPEPYTASATDGDCANSLGLPNVWHHFQCFRHEDNNGFATQLAYPLNNWNESIRFRSSSGTTWSGWKKILCTSRDQNVNAMWYEGTAAPTGTARLNYSGYLYATRTYNAVWNDYAEYFLKEKEEDIIEVGEIVMVSEKSDNYIKAIGAYNTNVVGVVSDSYGHIVGGTGDEERDEKENVAIGLSGRVNVKIVGNIKKGDLIVCSDIAGVGMKSETYIPGSVVGKAVENKTTDDIGLVKMFILNS